MRPWYEPRKDRPDIAKDAPKKKGIARFFETLWREFFALIKLNLLFILTCIPVVTIPASLTAMNRITATMVRDENHFLWADYWKAFKRDFWKSLLGGVLLLLAIVIFLIGTRFYYLLMATSRFFVVLAAFSACLALGVYMMTFYFFPMLALVELPMKQLLKNSCILTFVNFKGSLLALLFAAIFLGLGVGLLPYSSIFALFILCSFTNLITTFCVYPAIEDRVMEAKAGPSHRDSYEVLEAAAPSSLRSAELGEFPELPEEKEK